MIAWPAEHCVNVSLGVHANAADELDLDERAKTGKEASC